MSMTYAFNYAYLDPTTGMCIHVQSRSDQLSEEIMAANNIIEIPVNDQEYLLKYYINGSWYEDAEGTIPWTSSLL